MNAYQALNNLDANAWATTSVVERLALIEDVQNNLKNYSRELGKADADMKNGLIGQDMVSISEGIGATVNAMGNTLMACRRLYESLAHGEMPAPISSRKIDDESYEVEVYPIQRKDKLLAGKQRGFLHVRGKPRQTNPLDKPAGVIAISGAGNYSSSIEMAMALFLENKAVIHKPHQLNEESDKVWEKIFAPVVERKALVFIGSDQGREMSSLDNLHSIYFTGSTGVAHAIQNAASVPLVSECGGNNPCLIVPGDRLWTDEEIEHQAIQIASVAKLNGGAVCGRPQTLITSRSWPQRDAFLDALRKAIAETTFAQGTYYPNVRKTKAKFIENQPTAERITPEGGKYEAGEFVLIPNVGEDDFAVSNEAFCQILTEVPVNSESNPGDFLDVATEFCNNKLLGSLGCMILVDNDTLKANEARLHQAINELNYGGIAINNVPPSIWLNGYLTWGGNGETIEIFVSGVGNFGNGLNFDNVTKSVIIDDFGAIAFEFTNRKQVAHVLENASLFSIDQSWGHFARLAGQLAVDGLHRKDF